MSDSAQRPNLIERFFLFLCRHNWHAYERIQIIDFYDELLHLPEAQHRTYPGLRCLVCEQVREEAKHEEGQ